MQKTFVPNHQSLASRALYNLRHFVRNKPATSVALVFLALMLYIGISTRPTELALAQLNPLELLRANVLAFGSFIKTLIMNAGALTQPLIEPLIHVAAFCWTLFSIAMCFWLWGYCRRKLG